MNIAREDALRIMMLLSALESWGFSTKNMFPDYLHEDLHKAQEVLKNIVLTNKK